MKRLTAATANPTVATDRPAAFNESTDVLFGCEISRPVVSSPRATATNARRVTGRAKTSTVASESELPVLSPPKQHGDR